MFTPISEDHPESSDLISYAKWFRLKNLKFNIKMHEINKWTASTELETFIVETSFQPGPAAAIKELHKLLRPIISEKNNV